MTRVRAVIEEVRPRSAPPTGQEHGPARRGRRPEGAARHRTAADPLTVALFSATVFLILLALLASGLRGATAPRLTGRVVVLRKIYRTRVITTVIGASTGGTSVSQSVSSSGSASAPLPVIPVTRVS